MVDFITPLEDPKRHDNDVTADGAGVGATVGTGVGQYDPPCTLHASPGVGVHAMKF